MNSNDSYDQVLSWFSSNWSLDSRQNIFGVVESIPIADRSHLAISLLRCDMEKRLERGERPHIDDYVKLLQASEGTSLDWQAICESALQDLQIPNSLSTNFRSTEEDPSEITYLQREPPAPQAKDLSSKVVENSRFGRYQLIRQIAKGGMGEVWLAEQQTPVCRQVAIKLTLQSRAEKEIQARFELERQALAILDHPNIANIFDAGTSADGIPFYVMEFVDGKPITCFCDEQNLTLRERLSLFLSICSAIQHAHQKGLIHRDLKPSNILVCWKDGQPVAKVIDFGLVKSLSDDKRLRDRTYETQFGTILGTLQYMSPEQATTDSAIVDHRTDIYSLGALLYELLTGGSPLQRELLEEQNYLRALQIIGEHEPLSPSRCVKNYDESRLLHVSQVRKTNPKQLALLLRGELDWIVLKAIEKEPGRRYQSVSELARDIESHLMGDLVTARPPSLGYRIRKFVQRHNGAIASFVVVLLVVGLALLGKNWAVEKEREKTVIEQQRTKQERDRVSDLETLSAEQKKLTEQQQLQLSQSSARANIQLAMSQWVTNQIVNSNEYLDKVPREHRGLAWGIANRMMQGSLVTHKFRENHTELSQFSHNVRFAAFKNYAQVSVVDIERGTTIATFPCAPMIEGSPKVSPLVTNDGRVCVIAASNHLIVMDVQSQKNLVDVKLESEVISQLAFDSAEKQLALGTIAGEVHIFDFNQLILEKATVGIADAGSTSVNVATLPYRLATLAIGTEPVLRIQFQEGDTKVLYATAKQIEVYDLATMKSMWRAENTSGLLDCIDYCPTGSRVFSADYDGRITVWDLTTQQPKTSFAIGKGAIKAMKVSPNGQWLACAMEDNVVYVFDTQTGKTLSEYKGHDESVNSIGFTLEGERLISIAYDGEVKIWPAPFRGGYPLLSAVEGEVTEMLCEPSGDQLFLGTVEGEIICWDRNQQKITMVLSEHIDAISALSISEDGRRLASSSADGALLLWDLAEARVIQRFKGHNDMIASIALSPSGDKLLSADEAGIMRLWSTESGKVLKTIRGRDATFTAVEFSADGSKYIAGDDSGRCRIWASESDRLVADLENNEDGVTSMALSRNGKFLMTGGLDGKIYQWELQTKKLLRTFDGHSDAIVDIAVSSNGDYLVSGAEDGSICLWDVEAGAIELQFSMGRYHGDYDIEMVGVALDLDRHEVLAISNSFADYLNCGTIMCWAATWQQFPQLSTEKLKLISDPGFHRLMLRRADADQDALLYYCLLFHSAWLWRLEPNPATYVEFHEIYDEWKMLDTDSAETTSILLPEVVRAALQGAAPSELVPRELAFQAADFVWENALSSEVDLKKLLACSEMDILRRAAEQYNHDSIYCSLAIFEMRNENWVAAARWAKQAWLARQASPANAMSRPEALAILAISLYRGGNQSLAEFYHSQLQSQLTPEKLTENASLAKLIAEVQETISKSAADKKSRSFNPGSGRKTGGFF